MKKFVSSHYKTEKPTKNDKYQAQRNNENFGTLNGYYIVDRKKLVNTSSSTLRLRITDFFIDDMIMSPRFSDLYDYYIPDAKKVELPDHDSKFSIRFASLNYQLQHRIHFQYKLEGYEEDWYNADKTRTVTYSGLPAGTYTFKVKAFLLESPDKYDRPSRWLCRRISCCPRTLYGFT